MLKELAEKIEDLVNAQVEPEIVKINDIDYMKTYRGYEKLSKPSVETITTNSLSGLVEMVKTVIINNDLKKTIPLIVNVDVNNIKVTTSHDVAGKYDLIIEGNPLLPILSLGHSQSVEELIIKLSTAFIETNNTTKFIESISNLRIVEEVEFDDNGIGQTVTAKKGAQVNQKYTVTPIVKLKPIRSYAEIEQVESKFLFRVNQTGSVTLHEADGGQWRYEVQKRIAEYLNNNLKELVENGQVKVIG